jgi:hypothetical protein
MLSDDGSMVPPRLVFKGVRNVAQEKLKDLPTNGKSGNIYSFNYVVYIPNYNISGEWKMSVSPKGFVTRELHLET